MTDPRLTPRDPSIAFCATGKTGLGHLRRVTNVANAIKRLGNDVRLDLYSNAETAGLAEDERSNFRSTVVAPRDGIAAAIGTERGGPVVVDTAVIPHLEKVKGPLCLLLRETVAEKVKEFRLCGGRQWDLVCVPNPKNHWMPDRADIGAKRIEPTGWIFRESVKPDHVAARRPRHGILVSSGGGGSLETACGLKAEVDGILTDVRRSAAAPIDIVQIAGPRLPDEAVLANADEIIDPGSRLNELFSEFDLVISTAGYNSVLELAGADVPVVLVPIARSLDDQSARANHWAPHLGYGHRPGEAGATAAWIAQTLAAGRRRAPVRLDEHGAERCARLLLEYVA